MKYKKENELNYADCSTKCGGDSKTNCGGDSEISIYEKLSKQYSVRKIGWITKIKDIDYMPM